MTMTITDLLGKKVVALVSGGLDSTTIIRWLSSQGVRVTAVTVDLGQPDEKDMQDIASRMKTAGAESALIVDGRELLAEYGLLVVQGQGGHEGEYLNTTGIARMATVKTLIDIIKDADVITHGATGRGNDQVRFELGVAHLAPGKRVYAPWRDPAFLSVFRGRKEMIEYCQKEGLVISATLDKPYSTDANFLGLTHEAGELESLQTPSDFVNFVMGSSPKDAPNKAEEVTIGFSRGRPYFFEYNGRAISHASLFNLFSDLNKIAGRNGVGIGIDVVENRRVGIKSRGVYESPGMTLLYTAYAKMLELFLDRERRKFFDIASRRFGDVIYEGEFFGPLSGDLLVMIKHIARDINGEVTFSLYKGNIGFVSANVPISLYDPTLSSMEDVGEFDHADSQGYLNIAAVTARTMARVGQTIDPMKV